MVANRGNKLLNVKRTTLCAAVTMLGLGLASGSVLAVEVSDEDYKLLQEYKKKEADKQLPPHEAPAPAHPSGSKSGSLAESATNPIANLVQFQVQNAYSWKNHNSDGYGFLCNKGD